MTEGPPDRNRCLVCRVDERLCALPLTHVRETMRPLSVASIPGAPPAVAGLAIIRGVPVPVVDLAFMLAGRASRPTRFVTLDVNGRQVAVAVDAVVGVRAIASETLGELPPLMGDAASDIVAAIGALDSQLLVVLHGARLLPEPVWNALEANGRSE
jgi:purine-binding chemotaxis protein CheW